MKKASTVASTQPSSQEVFSDFIPPQTTDGSYLGTMKKVRATEDHLQRKFNEKLAEIKIDLKKAKCKVGLKVTGGSIQLQATLPPKPTSDKVKSYQQLISLGIPANLEGLKTAKEEAMALDILIVRKQFQWNEKYLQVKLQEIVVPTIGDLLDIFENEYFKSHEKTLPSQNSVKTYVSGVLAAVDRECLCLKEIIEDKLAGKSIAARRASVSALHVLFKTCGIDIKLTNPKGYKPIKRDIPTDTQIIEGFLKYEEYFNSVKHGRKKDEVDNWMMWRWFYGMMATFGVRPRELFVTSNLQWWTSEKNIHNTWQVDKETKTGYREVIPFVPEWIELFDLKNSYIISLLIEYLKSKKTVSSINSVVVSNAAWFRKAGVGFSPYDLRHACAIRSHLKGTATSLSAGNLGHSTFEHTRTYHRWIDFDMRLKGMNDSLSNAEEINLLRDEVIQLKLEIERLKIENERYRLGVSFPDILR